MGKKSPPKLVASAASKGDRRSPIRFKKQRCESAQRLPQRFEPFSIGTQLPNHRQNAHISRLIVSNPDTGDQVTTWQYGTTLATDGIARTDLLKAKIYPLDVNAIGQVIRQITYTYDQQGRVTLSKDTNGTEHAYVLDKLSRVTQDRATVLGTGINAAVRRIALEYTDRGQLSKVSSHNNATVGSGTIVNQVALSYNAFNQLIEDAQSHSGATSGSTPKLGYSYADGTANQTRRLTTTYPSDKIITMSYGSANSADDRLSRLAGVAIDGEGQPLGEFAWMGAGRLISLAMPQPGIALSYKHAAGQPVGDAGDPYSGYDRFGRTVDMRWIKTSDQSSLSRIQYGYDKMSRRLWRQDLAAPADTKQDRFYSYDGLGQVTDSALGNLNINRTAVAGIPTQREAFDYDSIGNWKQYLRQANGDTTLDQKRTSNQDNQLTELDSSASGLSYDAAGNMTACRPDKDGDWSKGYAIVWDAWNRIVQVNNAQTIAAVATYAYDGLTRRITTTIGSTVRRYYYNDQWKCVEERVGSSSNPDRVYYWSTRKGHRDELLRRDRATSGGALNETLWCLMDYFDPIAVVNGTGVVQERYSYTAFGLVSILTPAFSARAASNFAWNFFFHGQFRDTETGWDNYGYRYYLPWLGRWGDRDLIQERDGPNLYAFTKNSSINKADIFGLAECGKGKVSDDSGNCCCPDELEQMEEPAPYEPTPLMMMMAMMHNPLKDHDSTSWPAWDSAVQSPKSPTVMDPNPESSMYPKKPNEIGMGIDKEGGKPPKIKWTCKLKPSGKDGPTIKGSMSGDPQKGITGGEIGIEVPLKSK
jgi:RHS repeat-associated protein